MYLAEMSTVDVYIKTITQISISTTKKERKKKLIEALGVYKCVICRVSLANYWNLL
jgi:hypothetical protein